MSRIERTQFRISWRCPDWPANKPTAARLYKQAALAEEWIRHLQTLYGKDSVEIIVEQREMVTSPWRSCKIGGAS